MPSRGMGAIAPSKMPTAKKTPRRDDTDFDQYAGGGKVAEKWIQKAINPEHKGSLRKALGAKTGEPIPAKKLAAAAKKSGKIGKRARLAETLKGLRKGK